MYWKVQNTLYCSTLIIILAHHVVVKVLLCIISMWDKPRNYDGGVSKFILSLVLMSKYHHFA